MLALLKSLSISLYEREKLISHLWKRGTKGDFNLQKGSSLRRGASAPLHNSSPSFIKGGGPRGRISKGRGTQGDGFLKKGDRVDNQNITFTPSLFFFYAILTFSNTLE